jgi:hypothetical protein
MPIAISLIGVIKFGFLFVTILAVITVSLKKGRQGKKDQG